jgi:hypothetical protein
MAEIIIGLLHPLGDNLASVLSGEVIAAPDAEWLKEGYPHPQANLP